MENCFWFVYVTILDFPEHLKGIGETVLVEDMHTRKRNMLEQVMSRHFSFIIVSAY